MFGNTLIPAPISESSGVDSYKSISIFLSKSNVLRATASVSPAIPAPLSCYKALDARKIEGKTHTIATHRRFSSAISGSSTTFGVWGG
jgi:hypothetical protein